jgi:ABC-type amino acid transport substrate-binding protein
MIKPHLKTKTIFCVGIFLYLLFALSGCAPKHRAKLDINNLSGKTIGAMIGYSSDYILTNENKNVQLRRFDAYSDMMMALAFHQLDAAAMEMDEAYVFCRLQPKYRIYGTFAKNDKYAYVLNPHSTELNKQFNSFIAEFRRTDSYKDMRRRVKECSKHPFKSKPVKNTGTGDKFLDVLVYDGWEPISYVNTKTHQWEGTDIELITRFANSIGARIKFHPAGSYTQAILDMSLGKADIFVCPDSLRLKKDLEKAGNVTMSDWVWKKDIVFIVNTADYK